MERDILEFDSLNDKDQIFDFVFCEGVLHHTVDPEKCFSNLVSLLKPGGMIYVVVYGKGVGVKPIFITPLQRLLGRIIPYKYAKSFVNRTKIGQSIYGSLLDNMYVPIKKSYRAKEIVNWYKSQNLVNIRVLKKYDPSKEINFYKKLKGHLFVLRKRLGHGRGSIRIIGKRPIQTRELLTKKR